MKINTIEILNCKKIIYVKLEKKSKLSKKDAKKSEDVEMQKIFGDHEVYENSPPSPIKKNDTPAPSPNGSLAELLSPGSPDSPQSEPANLIIDENDVIKKFTVGKADMKVALEKPEVRIFLKNN